MAYVNKERLFEVLKNDLITTTDKSLQSVADSLSKEIVNSLVALEIRLNNSISSDDQLSFLCEKDIDILSDYLDKVLHRGMSELNRVAETMVDSASRKIREVYSNH